MKAWTRWQDWAALVAGGYAVLCPIWTDQTAASRATVMVMGVLLVLASLWSLAQPGAMSSEYVHAALGALLFIAPWALSYSAMMGASWTSWVVGVLVAVLGLWTVMESAKMHGAGTVGSH
jgi:hypothetical protein